MTWDNKVTVTLHNDSTENFYTGDIVTGVITLDLAKDLKADCIYMEVVGLCQAQWSRFTPTVPYLKIYSEKKKVLSVRQNNLVFEGIGKNNTIQAGIHCFPFHFALPHDLPSTFKSSIASVNYFIKIKSKPAYKIRKMVAFNVLANVNLNHLDDMLKPYEHEFQQSFRGGTKVVVHLKTYKSFAPRQIIPFEITLGNEQQVRIKKIQVVLVQKLRYTVSSGHADDARDMCQVDYKQIENISLQVCNFDMEIPQIAPSSINLTEPMIDISYQFKVEIFFSYHHNIIENIPVNVAAFPVIHNDF